MRCRGTAGMRLRRGTAVRLPKYGVRAEGRGTYSPVQARSSGNGRREPVVYGGDSGLQRCGARDATRGRGSPGGDRWWGAVPRHGRRRGREGPSRGRVRRLPGRYAHHARRGRARAARRQPARPRHGLGRRDGAAGCDPHRAAASRVTRRARTASAAISAPARRDRDSSARRSSSRSTSCRARARWTDIRHAWTARRTRRRSGPSRPRPTRRCCR